MKILHLYKDYYPVRGGIENHVKLLAEAQSARGNDVTVLVTSLDGHTRDETLNGVRVIYAARRFNLSSAPFSIEHIRRIGELDADIAHLHSPYPLGEAAYYVWGRGRRTVLTYHSDIVRQRVMGALYTPILQRVLARVNRIIATSPRYIETSPILGLWRDKCTVVPLAVPPLPSLAQDTINPSRTSRHGDGVTDLLFVGRLRYYKGVNYLLQAMPEVPSARLTIVGSGPKEQEWKRRADELGIAARLTWVGEVSDEALGKYYRACDIFVLPCSERSEAFGVVQLEAMTAGKPVISCDVGTGVAWVNQNEVTGLVVPPKEPRALASAIARLIADPLLRERMGAAGSRRVAAEFTVENMVNRVMKVYEEVLNS